MYIYVIYICIIDIYIYICIYIFTYIYKHIYIYIYINFVSLYLKMSNQNLLKNTFYLKPVILRFVQNLLKTVH